MRVVGEHGTATVQAILTAVSGGVLLETEIGGFRNWNVDELRLVKRGKPMRKEVPADIREKLKSHWRKTKRTLG